MRELMMFSDHFPVSFEVRLAVFRHQAAGLSRIRRWNGACDVSVAQHGVQACDLASPEAAGYALIHDVEEFDTGDITTPVKNTMRALGVWQRFESEIVLPIRRRFTLLVGLKWPWPEGVIREIHEIDQRLKAIEYRDCACTSCNTCARLSRAFRADRQTYRPLKLSRSIPSQNQHSELISP